MFFIASVQMLYYLGVMQWVIKHFAWFFFKTMYISGAEAVVAAASPFVGQAESVCLVRPYVDIMTESEIHLSLTSGKLSMYKNVITIRDLKIESFRVLDCCRFHVERIHQLRRPGSEPRHCFYDEYPCFYRH